MGVRCHSPTTESFGSGNYLILEYESILVKSSPNFKYTITLEVTSEEGKSNV